MGDAPVMMSQNNLSQSVPFGHESGRLSGEWCTPIERWVSELADFIGSYRPKFTLSLLGRVVHTHREVRELADCIGIYRPFDIRLHGHPRPSCNQQFTSKMFDC